MKTFPPPPKQPRIVEKRSTTAANVTGKGKTAPVTAKRRGGAAVDVSRPRNRWEAQTWDLVELAIQTALVAQPLTDQMSGVAVLLWHDRMWKDFEDRLEGLRPEKKAELRKEFQARLPPFFEEMVRIRAEKTERWATMPLPSQSEIRMRVFDSLREEIKAEAEAEAGLTKFQKSRTGLDAARVELMEEEAGADIAAHVAAEHADTPKQEWAIARALEELGWWLAEAIPSKGGKKARWEKILPIAQQGKPGFFTPQHRYTLSPGGKRQREKSPERQTISTAASRKLLNHLRAKLDNAQASGDDRVSSAARIMMKWEKGQAAVVHFLTLFHQRCAGTRREVLERRQRLAEADAHRLERPRKVGDTKEKASKTRENDLAWIRIRQRTP